MWPRQFGHQIQPCKTRNIAEPLFNVLWEGRNHVAFNSLIHITTLWKQLNSLLFTNSFKGSFSCRNTITSPLQCRTII